MSDYLVESDDLTAVADAIRTKGGTEAPLTFPDGFVAAVRNIPSGGGVETFTVASTKVIYDFTERNNYLSGIIDNYDTVLAILLTDWSIYTSDKCFFYLPKDAYIGGSVALTGEDATKMRYRALYDGGPANATKFVAGSTYIVIREVSTT